MTEPKDDWVYLTPTSSSDIQLSWSPVENAVSYHLHVEGIRLLREVANLSRKQRLAFNKRKRQARERTGRHR